MRTVARTLLALAALTLLAGCTPLTLTTPQCRAVANEPTPTAAQVCGRLASMQCPVMDCEAAYAEWQGRLGPDEFARVTSCYMHANGCAEVGECQEACGPGSRRVQLGPAADAASNAADAAGDATGAAVDVSDAGPGVDAEADSGGGDAGSAE
jgi:hypothetical protein